MESNNDEFGLDIHVLVELMSARIPYRTNAPLCNLDGAIIMPSVFLYL